MNVEAVEEVIIVKSRRDDHRAMKAKYYKSSFEITPRPVKYVRSPFSIRYVIGAYHAMKYDIMPATIRAHRRRHRISD